ncbi:uncharacterized protein SPPG_06654 [Spizellomyces punctatus DAOM BR117]|uniref:Uncharacterized protein n=1 Tax=Spizellomyces punctatus (strain DAOM BR117) TaxID=645134 RepID=A0A0L0H9M6_SPIPD|nr:uncharacterized protein SPPG_06654 [Spizellomyces punctatus DAOM BR117]KNC98255.1 hypothetical protein SPPG_06654 [Spizellomyces punctatus DAOM BR117]|eukprot:XP_016606295.1 hypothetical protein SPPG_06654 [Spizellomyces punctatus DAOM BR117]
MTQPTLYPSHSPPDIEEEELEDISPGPNGLQRNAFKRLTRAHAVVRRFKDGIGERGNEDVASGLEPEVLSKSAERIEEVQIPNNPVPSINLTPADRTFSSLPRSKSVRFHQVDCRVEKPGMEDMVALDLDFQLPRSRPTRNGTRGRRLGGELLTPSSPQSFSSGSRSPSPMSRRVVRSVTAFPARPSLSRRQTLVVTNEEELMRALNGGRQLNETGEGWKVENPEESEDEEFFDVDDKAWVDEEHSNSTELQIPTGPDVLRRKSTIRRGSCILATRGVTITRKTTRRLSTFEEPSERNAPLLQRKITRVVRSATIMRKPLEHVDGVDRKMTLRRVSTDVRRGTVITRRAEQNLSVLQQNQEEEVEKDAHRDLNTADSDNDDDTDIFLDADETLWIDEWSDDESARTITKLKPSGKKRSKKPKKGAVARRRTTLLVSRSFYETLAARAGETISHLGNAAQVAAGPVAVVGGGEMAGLLATAGAVARGVGGGLVGKFGRRTTQMRVETTADLLNKYTTGQLLSTAAGALGGDAIAENKAVKALSQGFGAAVEGGVVAGVGSLVVSGVALNLSNVLSSSTNYISMAAEAIGHLGNVAPFLPGGLQGVAEAAGVVGSVLGGVGEGDDSSNDSGEEEGNDGEEGD